MEHVPLSKLAEIVGQDALSGMKNKVYPSRVLVSISPATLTYQEMVQISMLSRFRSMDISLEKGNVCVEVFKEGARKKRAREESFHGGKHEFEFECKDEDRELVSAILSGFANMHRDLSRFDVHVLMGEEGYEVTLTGVDDVLFSDVKRVVESYKAFLKKLRFDFKGKKLRFSLENVSPKSVI